MKLHHISPVILFFLCPFLLMAQQKDPVLFTVNGNNVTKSEFLNIYNKNNNKTEQTDSALRDYLDLYINFKLKVKEAEEKNLDTVSIIKNELNTYRQQLAKSFLIDKEITEKITGEAYERLKSEVKAKHILLKLPAGASAEDEEKAKQKLTELKRRAEKGEDFNKLMNEVNQNNDNNLLAEDLGYFTALQMVYPFETAAYTTPAGKISDPVRTRFGYHIVKVEDKRPARGEVRVAHIFKRIPKNAGEEQLDKLKDEMEDVYDKIKDGEMAFEEAVQRYSEDVNTKRRNGELPWFGAGRMVPAFEEAAFTLEEDGAISKPVRTDYGFHIIKRLEKRTLPPYDEVKQQLKKHIENDPRLELGKEKHIENLKKEYSFKEYTKAKDQLFGKIDSSLLHGSWRAGKAKGMEKTLFRIEKKKITQQDFAQFIESNQKRNPRANLRQIYDELYSDFTKQEVLRHEEALLEASNPEFRNLMQEYRDGVLLFELTDQKVWSKAVKDTAGLRKFYEQNKSNYMWGERIRAIVYRVDSEKTAEEVKALLREGKSHKEIIEAINKSGTGNLSIEGEQIYEKGDHPVIDGIIWKMGISNNVRVDDKTAFARVTGLFEPEPKQMKEAKGYIIADYQEYLEKEWIRQLREKYQVNVNNDAVEALLREI